MLGKLLKYDMKYELRNVLPMYLIALGLCICVRLMSIVAQEFSLLNTLYGFLVGVCIVALIVVAIWTMIAIITYFYNNMLKDEGYLINTLPVTHHQIILSKEISGFFMMLLAAVVILLGIVIAFYHGGFKDFISMISSTLNTQGIDASAFLIWMVVILIINSITWLVMMFAAMMLGQTRNTNKVMYSIVYGIILYIILQVVSMIGMGIDALLSPNFMDVMNATNPAMGDIYHYLTLIFITAIVISCIAIVAFHSVSVYIANRKLNLE